ncbi:MAG: flagellin FliC [Magnetococcales bacterium]|nr:flagellin FliC [Magnetococcales bacterium]
MAMYINTNVASINARRNLDKSTLILGKTFNKLASGLRINSAADDAAGLAISTRMTAQIKGLNMASRNANDAISLAQVSEGAMDETTNAMQRIRELAVQASNDTLTTGDRNSLQKEVDQLLSEIDRIANNTRFNNIDLLTGDFSNKQFQIGALSGQNITFSIRSARISSLGVSSISITTVSLANSVITTIDTALNSIADIRANLGAVQNRFESVIANLNNVVENLSGARSRIMDADLAEETAKLTKNSILQQAGTAVLSQANQQPQLALQLLGG